jgi:hypothetical protein
MNIPIGFIVTDFSDETLQMGRKINDFSWEFWEWIEVKSAEEKLALLDDYHWRKETIDVRDYSFEDIDDTLSGYMYERISSNTHVIKDWTGNLYSLEDSIRIICECLFEEYN